MQPYNGVGESMIYKISAANYLEAALTAWIRVLPIELEK
jgi:hypothetical protein